MRQRRCERSNGSCNCGRHMVRYPQRRGAGQRARCPAFLAIR
nr:MAG TPA: hypothetical protein [Caudoviricetes sp.]